MKIEVTGDDDVIKALQSLGGKVERKVLRSSMRKGLKPLLAEARDNAPVDSGKLKSSLTIRAAIGKKKRGAIALEVRPNEKKFAGGHYYPAQVEYGKSGQPPNPFMLEAFSHRGEDAKNLALRSIAEGIDDLVRGS